jgi:hypothetical protein
MSSVCTEGVMCCIRREWQSFKITAENAGSKWQREVYFYVGECQSTMCGLNHREDEIILMKVQNDRRQARDVCITLVVFILRKSTVS